MADSGNRRGSLRVPRARPSAGTNRGTSVRNSGAYDDFRHPSGPPPAPAHSLRAASSRFSLNEQFAATRKEYELWDDDGSSMYDRATIVSEAGDGAAGAVNTAVPSGEAEAVSDFDYYNMLCLPRDADDLSPDQIRRAYFRLFLLFYPDSYPEHLRPIARQQFLRAQEAFEVLINPARRAQYDLGLFIHDESVGDGVTSLSPEYESSFKEAVWDRLQNGIQTVSDMGVRLDVSKGRRRYGRSPWHRASPQLKLLDFALSQSVSVNIPALRQILQPQVTRLELLALSKMKKDKESEAFGAYSRPSIEVSTPTITASGSVYGVAGDLPLMPTTLLYDHYQPLLPSTIPRHRLIQLIENKLSPLVTLRYRQEFVNRAPPTSAGKFRWVKTAVEADADLLPEFSATSRLHNHIILPDFDEPTIIETSIQSSRHVPQTPPRLVLGLHQNLYHGTAFLRADSGDWTAGSSDSCRYFADFSRMNSNMFSAESPLKMTPNLELGFRTGPLDSTPAPGTSDPTNRERGIRGLDQELNTCKEGTWAASASATPSSMAGFIRYSKDLKLPLFFTPEPMLPSTPASARVEVELCSNTFRDRYLAFRNLWTVGQFSRFGLEVGVSTHNFHLSAYWSRLGQRLSVPLLVAPQELLSPSILFWAGALPFAGLAALQLFLHQRRGPKSGFRARRRQRADLASAAQVAVAHQQHEADNVTILLAQPVEVRQKRQASLGGLVIVSAKYGILDEDGNLAGEHVADVTIALSALIDDSSADAEPRLFIPSSVRKSRIPGFWDPAPGQEKLLRVHYTFRGTQGAVDVHHREALILPPLPARQ